MNGYKLSIWENEALRDIGEATDIYEHGLTNIEDLILLAKEYFFRNNYACIEVVNLKTGLAIFNIDNTGMEFYNKYGAIIKTEEF